MLGHDLRTPLNAVKMAGALIAQGQMAEQHAAFATKIVTAADRMNRMIAHLLDFAAARSGGLKSSGSRAIYEPSASRSSTSCASHIANA